MGLERVNIVERPPGLSCGLIGQNLLRKDESGDKTHSFSITDDIDFMISVKINPTVSFILQIQKCLRYINLFPFTTIHKSFCFASECLL